MTLRSFRLLTVLFMLALAGCGSLPANVRRPVSHSLPPTPDQSPIARLAADQLPAGAQSGFRLLPLGSYALDARLALIRHASRTLDLQYYIWDNDESGRAIFSALKDAAERGVRVRLLLDDLNTASVEELLQALSRVPNLEIRVFNPFCCARTSLPGRLATSLGDLPRLDHRMHNKLLIADGALAMIGGRNIADEYFARNPVANFIDLDAIAAGRVVPQLAMHFDRYWNSDESFPVAYFSSSRDSGFDAGVLQKLLPPSAGRIEIELPEKDLLGLEPVSKELQANHLTLVSGLAYAVADRPSKRLLPPAELESGSLMTGAVSQMLGARSEMVVTSPYLVPGKRGMGVLQSLQQKGVRMTLVTNSLPATDSAFVYFGYARYRPRILKTGVEVYEVSASTSQDNKPVFGGGSSRGRLHAKLAVIDEEVVLLGSLNLDPRSARRNTELGVAVDSPDLAKQALRIVEAMKAEAYRVRLESEGGALEWIPPNEDDDQALNEEPGVSALNALQRLLLNPLVPEDLL
ncbi:phospholipase D family protein [Variovorax sp. J2P1-59]|uniref:phospholipase D-like domain-containing protein n=1 Tax=Variovorax flavidus TaxID=3053501 RepID=UPI0025750095|nr:phospholipase D family protein [Variovorax sp. J2P1-59]MDM0074974.1 phospholipase D family protein [Variovorax sp. J2P1-59]